MLLSEANIAAYSEDLTEEQKTLLKAFSNNSNIELRVKNADESTLTMFSKKTPVFEDNTDYQDTVDYLNTLYTKVNANNKLCNIRELFNEDEETGEITSGDFLIECPFANTIHLLTIHDIYFNAKHAQDVIQLVYDYLFSNPILRVFDELSNAQLADQYVQTLLAKSRRNYADLLILIRLLTA